MSCEKGAAAPTATRNKDRQKKRYQDYSALSSPKRAEKIAIRRADMPRKYRGTYDKAVKGKSRRAAIDAMCLECVMWKPEEVRKCTALACPLYAVRPYQSSGNGHDGGLMSTEGDKSGNKG